MGLISIQDLATQKGWDRKKLYQVVYKSNIKTYGNTGDKISDSDIPQIAELYAPFAEQEKAAAQKEEAERAQRAQQEMERIQRESDRRRAISQMLVSSGFSFDGYTVTKYSGYISGDDTIEIDRDSLNRNNGQYLTDCLAKIRIQALKELKEAAYDLGCNAIIGVDFDYLTFEPETISGTTHYYMPYMICVTANGNAVVIEKNKA